MIEYLVPLSLVVSVLGWKGLDVWSRRAEVADADSADIREAHAEHAQAQMEMHDATVAMTTELAARIVDLEASVKHLEDVRELEKL